MQAAGATVPPSWQEAHSGSVAMKLAVMSSSTLQVARQQVASRSCSATELTKTYLRGLHAVEGKLNSFISVADEQALQQAAEIDKRLARGEDVGPLAGIPIAIKVSCSTTRPAMQAGTSPLPYPPHPLGHPCSRFVVLCLTA